MNTDKYEGHTEGPWELSKYTGVGGDARLHTHVKDKRRITDKSTVLFLHRRRLAELTKADTLLIVDAPLLLEEVKRLTQLNYEQRVEMQRLRDAFGGVERMVENVRGVFE